MSRIAAFTNFIKDRQYAESDLAQFADIIEPTTQADGSRGYKMRPIQQADKITQRCKVLIQYTWHCRDYVKKILDAHGVAEPGRVVNGYIASSRDVQVASYLANEYKHAGTDASQKWAVDLEPRYGKPFVHGVLQSFPHKLKPTLLMWGDSIPEFEFVGSAGVGEATFHFADFTWTFSCTVLDKDGKSLGHAAAICESTFGTWLRVLSDNGITLP